MKKILLLILLIPVFGLSQQDECVQFKAIIDHFENDTTFRKNFRGTPIRLSVSNRVGSGFIWPFLQFEYLAIVYDLEEVDDWRQLEAFKTDSIREELKKKELNDTSSYHIECLSNLGVKNRGKIKVRFYRNDFNTVAVWTERIFKRSRHSYGMHYLFSFDHNDQIDRIFYDFWEE